MKIFVTGFHRAGTHSAAQYLSSKYSLHYFEEARIRWDSLEAAEALASGYSPKWEDAKLQKIRDLNLDKGFVLQCPGLAHETERLAELGKVYWAERSYASIVASMHINQFDDMAWYLMNKLHDKFPNDPVWSRLTYEGEPHKHKYFVEYYKLYVRVKRYFYEKHFRAITELIKLEDQPYFDRSKPVSAKRELKNMEGFDESVRLDKI